MDLVVKSFTSRLETKLRTERANHFKTAFLKATTSASFLHLLFVSHITGLLAKSESFTLIQGNKTFCTYKSESREIVLRVFIPIPGLL